MDLRNNLSKFAEISGILLGDGSISPTRIKISFNSRDDKDFIFYVKNLLNKLFEVEPILKYRKNENTADLFIFRRNIIQFVLNGVGLKLSPKWNKAVIPSKFMLNKLDLLVLRGYFDTDGCLVTTNNNGLVYPRLEMKICPSPMQSQFIKILKKYSFRFGVYKIGRGKIRVQLNGKDQLRLWLKLVGFSNKKHLDKVKRFI